MSTSREPGVVISVRLNREEANWLLERAHEQGERSIVALAKEAIVEAIRPREVLQ